MATYTPTPVAVASGSFSIAPGAAIVFYTVPAGMYARMRITATLDGGTSPLSLLAAGHRIFTLRSSPTVAHIYAEAILPSGTTLQSDNAAPGTGGVVGGWSAEFYPNP